MIDGNLAWRFGVAFIATAISVPLFASLLGAPVGLLVFWYGCKPLRLYFIRMSNKIAADKLAAERRRKNAHVRGRRLANGGQHP